MNTTPAEKGLNVRKLLNELEIGHAYFVDRIDWNWLGKTPRVIINDIERTTDKHFKFEEEASGNGWVITRLG
jgi:hypothetical protein